MLRLPRRRAPAAIEGRLAALPPSRAPYVVIDTELTGLNPKRDSILSLGGVWMDGGRIELRGQFYREVDPGSSLSGRSIVVHGITPAEVRGRPRIAAALEAFVEFCCRDILVGHFLAIDLAFLREELARCRRPPLANPAVDTWKVFAWLAGRPGSDLPAAPDPRLEALAGLFGIECRGAHNALTDAFITAQVFQRLLARAERQGVTTVEALLRIGDPFRGGDGLHAAPSLA